MTELKDAVNDPNFFESDDDGATVYIVELPPDKVNIVSDIEDIDENTLEDSCPRDVPGRLEVHSSVLSIEASTTNLSSTSTHLNNNDITRTVQKTKQMKKAYRKSQKTKSD